MTTILRDNAEAPNGDRSKDDDLFSVTSGAETSSIPSSNSSSDFVKIENSEVSGEQASVCETSPQTGEPGQPLATDSILPEKPGKPGNAELERALENVLQEKGKREDRADLKEFSPPSDLGSAEAGDASSPVALQESPVQGAPSGLHSGATTGIEDVPQTSAPTPSASQIEGTCSSEEKQVRFDDLPCDRDQDVDEGVSVSISRNDKSNTEFTEADETDKEPENKDDCSQEDVRSVIYGTSPCLSKDIRSPIYAEESQLSATVKANESPTLHGVFTLEGCPEDTSLKQHTPPDHAHETSDASEKAEVHPEVTDMNTSAPAYEAEATNISPQPPADSGVRHSGSPDASVWNAEQSSAQTRENDAPCSKSISEDKNSEKDEKSPEKKVDSAQKHSAHEVSECWSLQFLPQPVLDLIYWRCPRTSATLLVGGLVLLLSLMFFSVISVFAYSCLLALTLVALIRAYHYIMHSVQKKTEYEDPLHFLSDCKPSISEQVADNFKNFCLEKVNLALSAGTHLFLLRNYWDSFRLMLLLWCLTYIGHWFNGLTLLTLTYVGLFTLPKAYDNNKQHVHHLWTRGIEEVGKLKTRLVAAVPSLKKAKDEEKKEQ